MSSHWDLDFNTLILGGQIQSIAREMNRCNMEDFYNSETTLYNTIMVDTCHIFDQTHIGHITSRVNAKGVNSSMIYLKHCKNLCKCHNVPSPSITIKEKKKTKE
jgi:hypothetical protein